MTADWLAALARKHLHCMRRLWHARCSATQVLKPHRAMSVRAAVIVSIVTALVPGALMSHLFTGLLLTALELCRDPARSGSILS
jgi:hypothetical protein